MPLPFLVWRRAIPVWCGYSPNAEPQTYAASMSERPELDPAIADYYAEAWDEDGRIRSGIGEIELIRTREIVERFLPGSALRVVDVGGASGVHAEWLLEAGHTVHLIDPVERHVESAIEALGANPRFTAAVGDGRALAAEDDSFDVVLLFGPLYHLQDRGDRHAVWSEAARVVRPGGIVFGAIITRFASLFSGLAEGEIFDPVFREIVETDLETGAHTNPDGREYFTTAYFHRPEEAKAEAEDAGLVVTDLLGVEGITSWIPRLQRSWEDPDKRQTIIDSARAIESEPSVLGLGPHVIVVASSA